MRLVALETFKKKDGGAGSFCGGLSSKLGEFEEGGTPQTRTLAAYYDPTPIALICGEDREDGC